MTIMTATSIRKSLLKQINLPQHLQDTNSIKIIYPVFWHVKVSCEIDPKL